MLRYQFYNNFRKLLAQPSCNFRVPDPNASLTFDNTIVVILTDIDFAITISTFPIAIPVHDTTTVRAILIRSFARIIF